MKRFFSSQRITVIPLLIFTLVSISPANASGYFEYYLDESNSKMTFTLTEQVTQTEDYGEFSKFRAYVSTGIDTPITVWNHTYSTWVSWDDYEDESKINGEWAHEVSDSAIQMYQENRLEIEVDINSMTASEKLAPFMKADSFNAEAFPKLTIKSLELTDTKLGKGMLAELTIRDATNVVYIPMELHESYNGRHELVMLKGSVEVDLMDFNFKPKKNYRPPFNKERNTHFGFVQLPFELNFELVFTDKEPEPEETIN